MTVPYFRYALQMLYYQQIERKCLCNDELQVKKRAVRILVQPKLCGVEGSQYLKHSDCDYAECRNQFEKQQVAKRNPLWVSYFLQCTHSDDECGQEQVTWNRCYSKLQKTLAFVCVKNSRFLILDLSSDQLSLWQTF